jgi:hypothetical protein
VCSNAMCVAAVQCNSSVYCDAAAHLCWTKSEVSGTFTQDNAKLECGKVTLGGATWRLPTRNEYKSISRYNTSSGSCTAGPCPVAQGPGLGGCYWPIEMGTCAPGGLFRYWTTDAAFAWIVQEAVMSMDIPNSENPIRCVAPGP